MWTLLRSKLFCRTMRFQAGIFYRGGDTLIALFPRFVSAKINYAFGFLFINIQMMLQFQVLVSIWGTTCDHEPKIPTSDVGEAFFFFTRSLTILLAIKTLEVAVLKISVVVHPCHLLRSPNQEFCLRHSDLLPWILPSVTNLRFSYFGPLITCPMYWVFLSFIAHSSKNLSICYFLHPRYFQHSYVQVFQYMLRSILTIKKYRYST